MGGSLGDLVHRWTRSLGARQARGAVSKPAGTRRRRVLLSATRILGLVAVIVVGLWGVLAQPTCRRNRASGVAVDQARLRHHVTKLSVDLYPRDWLRTDLLDQGAEYIAGHFRSAGATVQFQEFAVSRRTYRNVIGRFGTGQGPRVIVGAHYDACVETPGADDNASGVAALIELAYLLGQATPARDVELVGYVLEEPPFFRTPKMGSAIHAQSVAGQRAEITGVIVLEMVGYFRDDWGSQNYPSLLLRLLYPARANFVAVVGPWNQGRWVKTLKADMKGTTSLPVYSIRAPSIVPGIDFSDHRNYWPYGIPAAMVTDTAFYRNQAYHTPGDTVDTLDYTRLAKVVVAVFEAVRAR